MNRFHAPKIAAVMLVTWAAAVGQEPDWGTMSLTAHQDYQAVDAAGAGTFPTNAPVKMQGVLLHAPSDMLDPTPGSNPFMGGQWQRFFQTVAPADFGGTAMYMGQNIGKVGGNHPAGSYTDAEWLAELDRLNHDPQTGRPLLPGDLVEVRARAPGLFFRGKTNVNEQHNKAPEMNFDIVLVQAGYGLPSPQVVALSDLKDASDQFIFDAARATGCERYQGTAVRINGVQFTSGTWGPGQSRTIADGTGRTFPVLLGRGEGFTRYAAPAAPFDIVGILDQEDAVPGDGFKAGYRLWVMDYQDGAFVLASTWNQMLYTPHRDYQAVDADGAGTFPTNAPVKMKGRIINRPADMLDPTPGSNPFMGGQWQMFVQADETGDFGGTALYMGQNIGKIVGNHPAGSYTDAEWLAELDRLSRDPVSGRPFRSGDLVEVRARAPGLFFRGKTNINEQHNKAPEMDFEIVLLAAAAGPVSPETITLADLKDASDAFIFDATRATGTEHYQGRGVIIEDVQFVSGTWGPGQSLTIADGSGRTFPVLLGRGSGFSRYPAPAAPFDIVGILDQEDTVSGDGFKAGYRLWVMDYDGKDFVLYRHVRPDFDRNGDVNSSDFDHFQACQSGPGVEQTDPACKNADFDDDNDVDQADFGVFQRCLSGNGRLPESDCDL